MPDFRILGPLEVHDKTGPLLLGGQKQRAVLALLLLGAGRVVSVDRLVEALWGEQPPRTAGTSLQNFISQLCAVAHGAQRIAKANETVHFFFERNMTANTSAHAFADEDCRCMPILFSRLSQCLSMRGDQLWQAVGTFPLFSHVRIIERRDLANLFETFLPALHPRMR